MSSLAESNLQANFHLNFALLGFHYLDDMYDFRYETIANKLHLSCVVVISTHKSIRNAVASSSDFAQLEKQFKNRWA